MPFLYVLVRAELSNGCHEVMSKQIHTTCAALRALEQLNPALGYLYGTS